MSADHASQFDRGCGVSCVLDVEHRDGPRYVLAVRVSRYLRSKTYRDSPLRFWPHVIPAYSDERLRGIPEDWIAR